MEIVLGSKNKKKLYEMDLLLGPLGFTLRTLDEFPESVDVEETGTTFQENAALKATQQAKAIRRWVIGEDSGLSVQALDGRPGVYSARFAGEDGNDEANNDKLLSELQDVPESNRQAFYTSHIALSDPEGNVLIHCENYCHGMIGLERQGSAGFGYDPLFIIPEYNQTFAELGDSIKSVLSHRARAIRMFAPKLMAVKNSLVQD